MTKSKDELFGRMIVSITILVTVSAVAYFGYIGYLMRESLSSNRTSIKTLEKDPVPASVTSALTPTDTPAPADNLFQNYTNLNDTVILPQGYTMALRWCLAERLMPMYGKVNQTQITMINAYAAQAKATVKRINMKPVQSARFADAMLASRQKDAGFILSGGFFR